MMAWFKDDRREEKEGGEEGEGGRRDGEINTRQVVFEFIYVPFDCLGFGLIHLNTKINEGSKQKCVLLQIRLSDIMQP